MTLNARAVRLAVMTAPAEVAELARKLCTVPIVRSVVEKINVNGVQVTLVVEVFVGEFVGCCDGTIDGA